MTSALLDQFVTEARDLIEQASTALLALEQQPDDGELVNTVFGAVHTLKGATGLFEIGALTRVVHLAEDLLSLVRSGGTELSGEIVDLLLAALDRVGGWLADIEEYGELPADAAEVAAPQIAALSALVEAVAPTAAAAPDDEAEPLDGPEWLAAFTEAERLGALAHALEMGARVRAVRYLPDARAFLAGEDPLRLVSQVPDRLAMRASAAAPWPALNELDPSLCNLLFEVLTTASGEALATLFRYVPDQVEIAAVPLHALIRPAGEMVDPAAARAVALAARDALEAPDGAERLRAVAAEALAALPVEAREASLLRPLTLALTVAATPPAFVPALAAALAAGCPDSWHTDTPVWPADADVVAEEAAEEALAADAPLPSDAAADETVDADAPVETAADVAAAEGEAAEDIDTDAPVEVVATVDADAVAPSDDVAAAEVEPVDAEATAVDLADGFAADESEVEPGVAADSGAATIEEEDEAGEPGSNLPATEEGGEAEMPSGDEDAAAADRDDAAPIGALSDETAASHGDTAADAAGTGDDAAAMDAALPSDDAATGEDAAADDATSDDDATGDDDATSDDAAAAPEIAADADVAGPVPAAAVDLVAAAALAQAPAAADAPVGASPKAPARSVDADGNRKGDPAKILKVDQARVDHLTGLIGELVAAKNALPYLARRAGEVYGSREMARELRDQFGVLDRIAQELQEAIMAVRMLPVGHVFQRFPQLVRNLSRNLCKDITLVLEGGATEADKTVVENLVDPLVHIVVNSIEHGIEMPEVRDDAGKPRVGTIRLGATQEGDRVVIEVSDDGGGIDTDRVRAKAVARGLVDAAEAAAMSEADVVNLVFAAGFSTRETVSDLSGRGVGMDVVRTAIDKAGGTVSLTSTRGVGSRVRLSLPLTMAVTRVMTIECAGHLYGVPMDLISETVRVPPDGIRMVKSREVFVLRKSIVPLVRLTELLALSSRGGTSGDEAVMVVTLGGERTGIVVDAFREVMEVIVKPMEGLLAGLPGYSGTALMGDGRVVLVLDLKGLC